MQANELPISEALLIELDVFPDERGYFKELYSTQRYHNVGIARPFVQDSLSFSKRDVIRGLHGDPKMAKLVHVIRGEIWDVVADIRPKSATYGRWHGEWLRAEEHREIYIPPGCLHGFLVTSDEALVLYKHTELHDAQREFGISWNDPDLSIAWPLENRSPILSQKDKGHPTLRSSERGFF